MSFDLKIATTCDHKIDREYTLVEDDRKTLNVRAPITSSTKISVFESGDILPRSTYNIVDINDLTIRTPNTRAIEFKERRKALDNFYEINYITEAQFCPKCSGLKIIDDWQYSFNGKLRIVREESLLLQNVEKWTITDLFSNVFHQFVGAQLVKLIGQKLTDFDFLTNKIVQEVNNSLGKFSDLQVQYETTGRPVTDGEVLQTIGNIEVTPDSDDPTLILLDVTVVARSGITVEFTQALRLRA